MFHEEIDKMQSDIDQMLNLCEEVTQAPQAEYEELGMLILRAQDGELDETGFQQLEKRLTKDKKALAYYTDFQWLTAVMYEQFGNHRLGRMIDAIFNHSATYSL